MKSVIQNDKKCFLCGRWDAHEEHHVFPRCKQSAEIRAKRIQSEALL